MARVYARASGGTFAGSGGRGATPYASCSNIWSRRPARCVRTASTRKGFGQDRRCRSPLLESSLNSAKKNQRGIRKGKVSDAAPCWPRSLSTYNTSFFQTLWRDRGALAFWEVLVWGGVSTRCCSWEVSKVTTSPVKDPHRDANHQMPSTPRPSRNQSSPTRAQMRQTTGRRRFFTRTSWFTRTPTPPRCRSPCRRCPCRS